MIIIDNCLDMSHVTRRFALFFDLFQHLLECRPHIIDEYLMCICLLLVDKKSENYTLCSADLIDYRANKFEAWF